MNNNIAEKSTSSISRIIRAWGMYGLIFIIISALLINGEAVYVTPMQVISYAILLIGFMKWYDIKVEDFTSEFGAKNKLWGKLFKAVKIPEDSFIRGFVYYIAFFGFTWIVMVLLFLTGIISAGVIYVQVVIPNILVQILIVSVIETLVFQVMLFIILKRELVDQANVELKYAIVPIIIISQLIFGLFHWYAFQGDLWFMILASISGVAFFLISWFTSPIGGMSAHASYNLFVLGITSGGIFGIGPGTLTIIASSLIIFIILGFTYSLIRSYKPKGFNDSISLSSLINKIKRCIYESKIQCS